MPPIDPHPFRVSVNVQRVAIQMIVRSHKVSVFLILKKLNHVRKLPRSVDVIVFGKINQVALLLLEKDVDLLPEGPMIPHSGKRKKSQVLVVKISSKQIAIPVRTLVQQHPELHSEAS
jgi:hypothetical protein